MKNKKIIVFLLLISLFTFSGCFDKKSDNKEQNKEQNSENTEQTDIKNKNVENTTNVENIESVTLNDTKNYAYVRTLDAYVNVIKNIVNTGKYSVYNTSTLYLFPVAKGDFVTENKDASPYNKEWKYIFVGVTYDTSVYYYYVLALDGSGVGVNLTTSKTLETEEIDKITEVKFYNDLYNMTDNKEYNFEEMNFELKELAKETNTNKIKLIVK